MSHAKVDIDRLGTLTLEHFERDSVSAGCGSASDLASNGSSPSYSTDEFESPVSSPNEVNFSNYSESWNSHSEEFYDKFIHTKQETKRGRQVKESVSKRNERERKRVRLISEGFSTLRKHIIRPGNRKLPKLQILRRAIYYIKALQQMLEENDKQMQMQMNEIQREREVVYHHQPSVQVSYMYNSQCSNVPTRHQAIYQGPYVNIYHPLPSNDMLWLHGYTQ